MSPGRTKLASALRLLCSSSEWEWLRRLFDKADFVPDVTRSNSPDFWTGPETGMPRAHRSHNTITSAFARLFFPEGAKRIDEIHKRNVAARRARAAAAALESDVKADAEGNEEATAMSGARQVGETATNNQKAVTEAVTGDKGRPEQDGDEAVKTLS